MKKVNFFLLASLVFTLAQAAPPQETITNAKKLLVDYSNKVSKEIKMFPDDPDTNIRLIDSYKNAYLLPIQNTIQYQDKAEPSAFVITGGWKCYGPPNIKYPQQPPGTMSEMWIRDAVAQLHAYIPVLKKQKDYPTKQVQALKNILSGFIFTATELLYKHPIAHAFTPDDSEYKTRVNPAGADYELDTPPFFIWFVSDYYKTSQDASVFTPKFTDLLGKFLYYFKLGQKEQFSYMDAKKDDISFKVIKQLCTKNCIGLSSSYTRASDDELRLAYNIPDNMLLYVALKDIADMPLVNGQESTADAIKKQASQLMPQVEKGLKFAIVQTPKYGKIYAYETDAMGQAQDNTFTEVGKKDFKLSFQPYHGKPPFSDPADSIEVTLKNGSASKILSPGRDFTLDDKMITLNKPLEKGYRLIVRGNFIFMDDANLPSLLSAPYFNYLPSDNTVYKATRAFVLSKNNPYYFISDVYQGEGSPHIGIYTQGSMATNAWPLGMVAEGLTTTSVTEYKRIIRMLLQAAVDPNSEALACEDISARDQYPAKNYMHESFDVNNPKRYTRGYFGWPNAYFAEWVDKLAPKMKMMISKRAHKYKIKVRRTKS